MRFTKVESVGNDYVLLDAVADPALASLDDLPQYAQVLSHRRTGVGADGLLILSRDTDGLLAMRVINADGSEGGVCANGLRCAVRLAIERGHAAVSGREPIVVRLGGREMVATPNVEAGVFRSVSVDMGPPKFGAKDVPIDPGHAERIGGDRWRVDWHELACASMGNPHAVLFDRDPDDLDRIGPALEHHPAFPERTNVHTARVTACNALRVDSWERGSGRTHACGSGVCAVVACAVRAGTVDGPCTVSLPGGSLLCAWSGDDAQGVILEGPARIVYEGQWGGGA
ncbi:MAG: diaminopimelate epimerase [Planctomycetota bacterium]